jgi:hypothetical protein
MLRVSPSSERMPGAIETRPSPRSPTTAASPARTGSGDTGCSKSIAAALAAVDVEFASVGEHVGIPQQLTPRSFQRTSRLVRSAGDPIHQDVAVPERDRPRLSRGEVEFQRCLTRRHRHGAADDGVLLGDRLCPCHEKEPEQDCRRGDASSQKTEVPRFRSRFDHHHHHPPSPGPLSSRVAHASACATVSIIQFVSLRFVSHWARLP